LKWKDVFTVTILTSNAADKLAIVEVLFERATKEKPLRSKAIKDVVVAYKDNVTLALRGNRVVLITETRDGIFTSARDLL
jgi:hypothetical protein